MKTRNLLIYSLMLGGSLAACSVQEKDKQLAQDEYEAEVVYESATATDTTMVTELMVERRFVRMPDTPQGYRVQALLDVMLAEDEEELLSFVEEHYAPDFIDQAPQNDHKAILRSLKSKISNAEVEDIEDIDNAYRISLVNFAENQEYILDVYFEPGAPYKISGVRML